MKRSRNRTARLIGALVMATAIGMVFVSSRITTAQKGSATVPDGGNTVLSAGTFPADAPSLGPIPDTDVGSPVCQNASTTFRDVTFTVTGISGSISKVVVSFSASHTFLQDLEVTLTAPSAQSLLLFAATGTTSTVANTCAGSANDLSSANTYTFGDAAAANWWTTAAVNPVPTSANRTVVTGIGGTTNPPTTTSLNTAFAPATANGTWTLRFRDRGAGDTGTVNAASLTIITAPSAANGNVTGRIGEGDGKSVAGAVVNLNGSQTRQTITDGNGNYRFDDVEIGGFYTVTPSRANYTFNPGDRAFSLTGNNTDAAFTGAFGGDTRNPVDTNEYFVRQQYLDFLGREPDEGGLAYWSNQLNQCGGDAGCLSQRRIDVSAAFFNSAEFQESGSYVYDMYAGMLGRTPGYSEFTPDRAQVVGGTGLDAAKAAFAGQFIQRSEFIARYSESMSRDQFIDAVIHSMQVRSGMFMTSLRDSLVADYDNGGRALVVRHAAESSMFAAAEHNKAFVLMEYFGYLQRGEDQGGYDFWLGALNQGGANNYRGMVCSFLTSTEYQRRFSTVVSHGNGECQ